MCEQAAMKEFPGLESRRCAFKTGVNETKLTHVEHHFLPSSGELSIHKETTRDVIAEEKVSSQQRELLDQIYKDTSVTLLKLTEQRVSSQGHMWSC